MNIGFGSGPENIGDNVVQFVLQLWQYRVYIEIWEKRDYHILGTERLWFCDLIFGWASIVGPETKGIYIVDKNSWNKNQLQVWSCCRKM